MSSELSAADSSTRIAIARPCAECGALYPLITESCATRFDQLLALDHSKQEPWGSRHGQAFAAFALQHPARFPNSVDAAWTALCQIYCLDLPPARVFAALRTHDRDASINAVVPARPRQPVAKPSVTIADLGDFAARDYASKLDDWCRAALRAWDATINTSATASARVSE